MRQANARWKATRWALATARKFISKYKRWKRRREKEGILTHRAFR